MTVILQPETLWDDWRSLFPVNSPEPGIRAVFTDLVARYREKHRYYHNLNHVTDCLGHVRRLRTELADSTAIKLALWFHDAVYKPRGGHNEEESAQLAEMALPPLSLGSERVKKVARLIRLTKHPSEPETTDENYLVDIDLAILGEGAAAYGTFEQHIRQEYRWVPGYIYRRERTRVLRGFLEQEHIYRTEFFRNERERQARENLEGAIAALG